MNFVDVRAIGLFSMIVTIAFFGASYGPKLKIKVTFSEIN